MIDFDFPYPSQRMPVMGRNVVATSQPLAAQAGLRMQLAGGNAVDAALAAAIALTVVEPSGNGLGSDGFSILWDGQRLHGLNASGRAPAAWTPERFAGHENMPRYGWESVTVPGAVSQWVALSERFGRLPFAQLFEPAVDYARRGFQVTPRIAILWQRAADTLGDQPGFAEAFMPVPRAGDLWRFPEQAASLEAIADSRGEAFYRGALAERMVDFAQQCGGALSLDDLATHRADRVEPIGIDYRGHRLHEMPPNGQGIAALSTLGMLERFDLASYPVDSVDSLHLQIEAMKLALADAYAHVGDAEAMPLSPAELLDSDYLAERARHINPRRAADPHHGLSRAGGTVYITAADESGLIVSLIQSNYMGFGSGVVVPGTGISLQNRGAGFSLRAGHPNRVGPGKRPFHTIIPGFLTRDGQPLMSFGVMGGPIQAQGHVQMVVRLLDYDQNPQAASDAPRWRVEDGRRVRLEPGFPDAVVEGLRARGHDIRVEVPGESFGFGGAQLILATEHGYVAGSDHRKDGQAVAY